MSDRLRTARGTFAKQTRCSRGHPLTGDNLGPGGRCLACRRAAARRLAKARYHADPEIARAQTRERTDRWVRRHAEAKDESYRALRSYQKEYKRRGRRAAGVPERGPKPACVNGHRLIPENRKGGTGECLACHRERERMRSLGIDAAMVVLLLTDPCCYCGVPTEHIDHIDPLSRGGSNGWTNLTASCAACNCSKAATPLLLWLAQRA